MTFTETAKFMRYLNRGDNTKTVKYVSDLVNRYRDEGYNHGWINALNVRQSDNNSDNRP